jgi:hypothetical protein
MRAATTSEPVMATASPVEQLSVIGAVCLDFAGGQAVK